MGAHRDRGRSGRVADGSLLGQEAARIKRSGAHEGLVGPRSSSRRPPRTMRRASGRGRVRDLGRAGADPLLATIARDEDSPPESALRR
eukprot:5657417-Alexandrium_andersonii.AAC.1